MSVKEAGRDSDSRFARTVTVGLRQRAWWVMRRRLSFTLPELLGIVTDGSERNADGNLRRYLQALTRCGILSVDAKLVPGAALTSNGFLRYRLEINNGPVPPVWRQSRNEVYEPNKGVVYPIVHPKDRKEADDA